MGSNTTTSTVTNTNLPDYAAPAFTEMLGRANAISQRPYEAYTGGQRIEDFNPNQQATQAGIMALQTPYGINTGMNYAAEAGKQALNTNYTPGSFSNQSVQAPWASGVANIDSSP